VLGVSARQFLSGWDEVYARSLMLGLGDMGAEDLDRAVVRILAPSLLPVGLVLAASFSAALMAGLGQSGGLKINGEALTIKPERLNPATNLGNIFSLRSMTRMAKSLIPAAAVVALGVKAMQESILPMPVMSVARLPVTLSACFDLMEKAAWVMVAWAALDYAVERMAWNKKLRMTKQEMRDEVKETMGNPQVKGRIRRIQNAMRRRKAKADISRASVVVTNPTHYAVALEFSFESMLAPTVLVKGQNLHALRIREEARWAGVPIVENPPLARSLYRGVEEGQAIPYELYAAVAGILAFLYRQQVEKAARERRAASKQAKKPVSTVAQTSTTRESVSGGGM
jgi:flagellar biosynthetic protein FlhB